LFKAALRPEYRNYFYVHDWFDRKLTALVAYGMVDKTVLSERAVKCVSEHFENGIPISTLAAIYGVANETINADIRRVFDYILENVPKHILEQMAPVIKRWVFKGCSHCGGDVKWHEDGRYRVDGEYRCLQCGRSYDEKLQMLTSKLFDCRKSAKSEALLKIEAKPKMCMV